MELVSILKAQTEGGKEKSSVLKRINSPLSVKGLVKVKYLNALCSAIKQLSNRYCAVGLIWSRAHENL